MVNILDQDFGIKPLAANRGWQHNNRKADSRPIFGGRAICAMGNRPQDHMDRDLLLASLLRDRRLPMFRKQCLELPAWAPAVPTGIPQTFRHQAQQLIMLASTHQHFIERLRASIDLAADDSKAEQMLQALEACPPRGALFSRGTLDAARPCEYARLCPWCHARSVERLYCQLLAGPCTPERLAGKHLIVYRFQVDAGDELDAQDVRADRDANRRRLRCVADSLGIEGGVILHQVTPWMPWYDRPCEKQRTFAHIFAMVGTLDSGRVRAVGPAAERIGHDVMIGDYELMMLSGTTPQALRYLLYGTSYKFYSQIGLLVKNARTVLYGVQGAAALQPWFLFDEQQAWSYVAAMQGTRLYDTFGTWRDPQAEQDGCSGKKHAPSASGEENRSLESESANARKHRDAVTRRRQLAAIALPCFQKFKDAGGKRLGSPALRKMLAEAGKDVSDRDARWLAKYLPSMDKRTAFEKFVAKRTLEKAGRCQERLEEAPVQNAE